MMGYNVAGANTGCGPWGGFGIILVLFILLVIIIRAGVF